MLVEGDGMEGVSLWHVDGEVGTGYGVEIPRTSVVQVTNDDVDVSLV